MVSKYASLVSRWIDMKEVFGLMVIKARSMSSIFVSSHLHPVSGAAYERRKMLTGRGL
jgi:hypothetical protein